MTGAAGQPLQVNDEASWGQSVGLPMSLPAAGDAGARAGGAVEDGEGGGLAAMGPLDEHLRLSTVAEELRGPLSALVAATELLVHDEPGLDATQVLAMVTGIQRRALWLQVLVENVLCAATLRAGRLKLRRQPLDVWEVVVEVLPVVEPLLASRRQPLRRAGRPGPPAPAAVLGDGRRLGQALVNLLLHASANSPPGQPIELTVARRGAALRVTVADHGPRRTQGAGTGRFHVADPPALSDLPAPPAGGAGASGRSAAGYEAWSSACWSSRRSSRRTAAVSAPRAAASAARASGSSCPASHPRRARLPSLPSPTGNRTSRSAPQRLLASARSLNSEV